MCNWNLGHLPTMYDSLECSRWDPSLGAVQGANQHWVSAQSANENWELVQTANHHLDLVQVANQHWKFVAGVNQHFTVFFDKMWKFHLFRFYVKSIFNILKVRKMPSSFTILETKKLLQKITDFLSVNICKKVNDLGHWWCSFWKNALVETDGLLNLLGLQS